VKGIHYDTDIRKALDRIYSLVRDFVLHLLEHLNIPQDYPVVLDPISRKSGDLKSLLSTIIGEYKRPGTEAFEDFFSIGTQSQLNINIFLQALLGAGIRNWCFLPPPEGKAFWHDYKWVEEGCESSKSPRCAFYILANLS
jgi:hypothetical protein